MTPSYITQEWYTMLRAQTNTMTRASVAQLLKISAPQLSQVLNGSGKYGSGTASTTKLAEKVLHTFGRYVCPHLSSESPGPVVVVTAQECKAYAHQPAPTGSPRAMQHWQACRTCSHAKLTAPTAQRAVVPRKLNANTQGETV